jgi:hypothetical protein
MKNAVFWDATLCGCCQKRKDASLMMEATTATWRHIPEDGILHGHCSENLKSYIALTGCAL